MGRAAGWRRRSEHAYSGILEQFDLVPATVRRAVVNDDDFIDWSHLAEHRLDGSRHIGFLVVDGDDSGDRVQSHSVDLLVVTLSLMPGIEGRQHGGRIGATR